MILCEKIFTAPPLPNGWRLCFYLWNRLCYNFLGDSKSRRPSKSHYWFKGYSDFAECVDFACSWCCCCGGQMHINQTEIVGSHTYLFWSLVFSKPIWLIYFLMNKLHGDGNQNILWRLSLEILGALGAKQGALKTHRGGHTYFLWSLVFSKTIRLN